MRVREITKDVVRVHIRNEEYKTEHLTMEDCTVDEFILFVKSVLKPHLNKEGAAYRTRFNCSETRGGKKIYKSVNMRGISPSRAKEVIKEALS